MKQAGRFLSKYIKRNFGVFAIYMLLCILCSILSLIAPYISGNFIDVEESIKDNMFLGGEDKSGSQKFIDITKLLGLDVFLKKLPNGLETIINENAMNLSGGEKQKLSLLRILLKDSEVLILDEPASALDTDSREQLYNYLNTIKRNSIIFIVTHDDKITDKVDHIINLSKNA